MKNEKNEKYYEEHFYLMYSENEHTYSDVLNDRQFMWVDYCIGKVIKALGHELHESGKFPLWDEETIANEVNNALGGTYVFFFTSEYYEPCYNEDENTVIENIYEALDELCDYDYAVLIQDGYVEWLQDEIKSLKREMKELKKEEKRLNTEVA